MSEVSIGKLESSEAIVNAIGPGVFYCNVASLVGQDQILLSNANVKITDLVYKVSGGTPVIQREDSTGKKDIFTFDKETDDISFSVPLDSYGDANVVIDFRGASGRIFVGLGKTEGFINIDP